MKKTILIFALISTTVFVACKKKDVTPTTPVQKCNCRLDSLVNVSQTPGVVVWQAYYGTEYLPQYDCNDDTHSWYSSDYKTKYIVYCE